MLSDLQYIAENGVLFVYQEDGVARFLPFSDIEEYLENPEAIEGGTVQIVGETQILFSLTMAGGQSGLLMLWDAQKHKIVHVSKADFCIAATIYGNTLIYLCEVSCFGMPVHYKMFKIQVGTINVNDAGVELFCDNPRKIAVRQESEEVSVLVENRSLDICIGEKRYLFASLDSIVTDSAPKSGYKRYYEMLMTVQAKALHGDLAEYQVLENMLL